MERLQWDLIDIISHELLTPVIHIEGETDRFLMGQIELPSEGDTVVVVNGFDVTTYFTGAMLQKPAEQVKLDLQKFMADARHTVIKFPTHNRWWAYS